MLLIYEKNIDIIKSKPNLTVSHDQIHYYLRIPLKTPKSIMFSVNAGHFGTALYCMSMLMDSKNVDEVNEDTNNKEEVKESNTSD